MFKEVFLGLGFLLFYDMTMVVSFDFREQYFYPINLFSSCKDRSFSQRNNKNRSDPYDFSLGITLYVKLFAVLGTHQEGVRLLKRNRLGFETASKFSKHLSSNLYVNRIKIINRFFFPLPM